MGGVSVVAFVAMFVVAPALARADAPPFEIQNARAPTGLAVSVPAGKGPTPWSRVVRVVVAQDVTQAASTDKLELSGVVETAQGAQAVVHATPIAKIDLIPGASVDVTLSATLGLEGTYKGELLLVQGAKQRVVPLQITVEARPAAVALPIASVGGTSIQVVGGSGAKVPMRVHNSGTAPLNVAATIVTVTRLDKADSPTVHVAIPEAQTSNGAQKIAPGAIQRFDLDVSHLDDAGIYAVEALFQSDPADGTYQAKSISMTVFKRDSCGYAALFIAIGAGLAWFIRWFVSDGNARLTTRRSFALLAEQVRTFRTGVGQEQILIAARALELECTDRERDLRWGGDVTGAKTLLERAQVRFALLQEVADAQAVLANLAPAGQEPARKTLDSALRCVRVDPGKSEMLTAIRDQVKELALRNAWREQLATQLAELRAVIAKQVPIATKHLASALRTIEQALAGAEPLLATDDVERLDALVKAQRVALLAADLAELTRLADKENVPFNVEPAAWAAVVDKLQGHLADAAGAIPFDARLAAFLAGQRLYFKTIATALADAAGAKATAGDSRAEQLRTMERDLRAAVARDPLEAGALAAELGAEIAKPDPKGVGKGQVGTDKLVADVATGWLPLVISSVTAALGADAKPASADGLRVKLRSYKGLTNLAVFIIAIATGIKVLYLDNLAWGGSPAVLLAFLWGAGIQVTGDAFTGIVGMRAKLGGLPAV